MTKFPFNSYRCDLCGKPFREYEYTEAPPELNTGATIMCSGCVEDLIDPRTSKEPCNYCGHIMGIHTPLEHHCRVKGCECKHPVYQTIVIHTADELFAFRFGRVPKEKREEHFEINLPFQRYVPRLD